MIRAIRPTTSRFSYVTSDGASGIVEAVTFRAAAAQVLGADATHSHGGALFPPAVFHAPDGRSCELHRDEAARQSA